MPGKVRRPAKKTPPRSVAFEKRLAAVKVLLDVMPAATISAKSPRGTAIYHVMAKTFAILWTGKTAGLILKSDRADMLRERYAGIGHKSHLDPRHWIFVELDADVPLPEIRHLIAQSYALVRAKLTGKQKAELEALSS